MKRTQFALALVIGLLLLIVTACQRGPEEVVTIEEAHAGAPAGSSTSDSDESTPTPETTTQLGLSILAEGSLVAVNPTLQLSFNASGRLATLNVAVGDVVEEGELIGTIDDKQLQAAVVAAENSLALLEAQLAQQKIGVSAADIAAAETQIQIAEIGVASAQASLDSLYVPADYASIIEADARVSELQGAYDSAIDYHEILITEEILGPPEEQAREQIAAAKIQLDAAIARANQLRRGPSEASIAQAEANILQAEANLASAQINLEKLLSPPDPATYGPLEIQIEQTKVTIAEAEEALADANLYAPWSGTVLSVDSTVGAMVGPGTPIVSIQDLSQIEFHTSNLSEKDLGKIEIGGDALITLAAYPNVQIKATVHAIGLQSTGVVGGNAVFPVMLRMEESTPLLRAGMTGRTEIAP